MGAFTRKQRYWSRSGGLTEIHVNLLLPSFNVYQIPKETTFQVNDTISLPLTI